MRQVIRDINIEPKESEVLKYLGYIPDKTEIDPKTVLLIKQMIEEAKELYSGLCIINTDKIKISADNELIITSAPKLDLNSLTVKEKLKGNVNFVSLIVVTIGDRLEQTVEQLFTAGQYAKSIILDGIGSAAVEDLTDRLEKKMLKKAEMYGYCLIPRFSPGYGDWPLSNQREIIQAANADEFGISVNNAEMLTPRKSITALIGWSKDTSNHLGKQKCGNKCIQCLKSDCKFRSKY